ncbi:MAG: hypothetical protein IK095_05195 [Oscillospiraceae bacterium]|nr:hypothetical protein [Oscillospiraceae bacterium]
MTDERKLEAGLGLVEELLESAATYEDAFRHHALAVQQQQRAIGVLMALHMMELIDDAGYDAMRDAAETMFAKKPSRRWHTVTEEGRPARAGRKTSPYAQYSTWGPRKQGGEMFVVICILMAMLAVALGVIVWLESCLEDKEEARKRAIREGGDWAWTKEKDLQVISAMELTCSICREPFRCGSQDELDQACDMCPMQDMLWALASGKGEQP